MIPFEEFETLAASFNVIPLVETLQADLHTPVSTYLALREEGSPSFLLESVEKDERIGRFSFVGIDPVLSLREDPRGVTVRRNGTTASLKQNIFDALESHTRALRQAPPFHMPHGPMSGFVGYLAYDAVRHLEKISPAEPPEGSRFDLFGTIARFDHRNQTLTIIRNVFLADGADLRTLYEEGRTALAATGQKLLRSVTGAHDFSADLESADDGTSREHYCDAVTRAKQYIREGEIFQVVLSRKISCPYSGDLFAAYRALRIINPSPYLFYLDFGSTKLAGSSPEVLVRVQDRMVDLLPIAGTRPRGGTEEADKAFEQELQADPKENAEHVMLVDLGRNDVGRVSEFGSVEVPVLARVDRYSHVMHLVSHVRGRLRRDLGSIDALRAAFPAGTVSGAPKVRAMEIINELETQPRGLYAGAVGYVGLDGALDTCIAIRTIFAHGNTLTIQTGAGIVADSVPEAEYEETVRKSQAMLQALRIASRRSEVPA